MKRLRRRARRRLLLCLSGCGKAADPPSVADPTVSGWQHVDGTVTKAEPGQRLRVVTATPVLTDPYDS